MVNLSGPKATYHIIYHSYHVLELKYYNFKSFKLNLNRKSMYGFIGLKWTELN